jgi:hypothetical protein
MNQADEDFRREDLKRRMRQVFDQIYDPSSRDRRLRGLTSAKLVCLAAAALSSCNIVGPSDAQSGICNEGFNTNGAPPAPGQSSPRLGLEGHYLGSRENKSWVGPNASLPDGFMHVEGASGGIGNTLQVVGCNQGVYLSYAGETLNTVAVREGWRGRTDGGLRIGSSYEEYRRLENPPSLAVSLGEGQERAYQLRFVWYWFKDGRLAGIEVSTYARSRVGPDYPSYLWR